MADACAVTAGCTRNPGVVTVASDPAVLESAVAGAPDEQWGEVPVAFVTVSQDVEPDALVDHVRSHLARFKAPKKIVFGDLPKTSTGKIQKNVLRDRTE